MFWNVPRLQHWLCGMHHHDEVLLFERNRIALRCVSCGYETPGWQIPATRPRRVYDGVVRPRARAGVRPQRAAA